MSLQTATFGKMFVAQFALVRQLAVVDQHVLFQTKWLCKLPSTELALKRFVSGMRENVSLQRAAFREPFLTQVAPM